MVDLIYMMSENIFFGGGDVDVPARFQNFKGPYADHILIPLGSTGSSVFFGFI